MSESSAATPGDETQRDQHLEAVIVEYIRACDAGDAPDRRQILESHPELADQLREFFANRDAMQRLAPPPGPAAPPYEQSTHIHSVANRVRSVIGPYTLVERLGEGGMGEVWVARQSEPVKRKVALKLIKGGVNSKDVLTRFEQERQALAMMDHPNIAKVFDGGVTPDGQPYFVMELVNGLPLTKFCDEARLRPRDRMELFIFICQAVQHAHQKGIVHRDLKPSNILVTVYDGRPVPKVIDFGVAKATGGKLTDATMSTQFGAVVGTLEYMSPEQAGFSGQDVDTRADIYSLGVILYELLTGLRPIDARRLRKAAFAEMIRILHEAEPSKPSTRLSSDEALPSLAALRQTEPKRLMALLRGELDWVVMKCLEKSRDRRYETVNGLARDVQRYLADEPVEARPPSAGYRLRKFLRRHKGPVTASVLLLLALIGGIVGTTWGLLRAENARRAEAAQRKIAEENEQQATSAAEQERIARQQAVAAATEERKQRDRADQNADIARRNLYAAHMNLAQQAWQTGEAAKLVELLEGQRPLPDQEDLRSFDWYYLWRQGHRGHLRTMHGHLGPVYSVAYSPDGKLIASASHDTSIRLWDAASGNELAALWTPKLPVRCVAFSPDGKELATGSWDGTLKIWNVATRQLRATVDAHSSWVTSVAFSPDGLTLASGGLDKTVKLWDVALAQERTTLKGHTNEVHCVAFFPDGKTLASVGGDFVIRLWDVHTFQQRSVLPRHKMGLRTVAISPDGKTIAAAGWDPVAILWDVATGQQVWQLAGHTGGIMTMAFSPDGDSLATGSWDRAVKLWDVTTGQERAQGTLGSVHAVAFSPDGMTLAAGGWGRMVQLWKVHSEQERTALKQGLNVESLSVSPDGKTIAAASQEGTIKLWDPATGLERGTLQGRTLKQWTQPGALPHAAVDFSPDGKALASAGPDHLVKLWDVDSRGLRATLDGHTGFLLAVKFSADGKTIASSGSDRLVKLWDVAGRQERLTLKGHNEAVQSIAFSPVGPILATVSMKQEVKIWDSDTGQELTSLAYRGQVSDVTFSPTGLTLASAGDNGIVKLWDVATWQERMTIQAHATSIMRVVFSPDGKVLATSSQDRSIKLWDATTGQERLVLQGHFKPIFGLDFAADGSFLASGCSDGTINIWRASLQEEATAAKENASPLFYFNYLSRARTSVRLGNYQQALMDFTTAVELTPLNPFANNELAWFLVACPDQQFRDYPRAIQHANSALELLPEQADFWTTLGAAHYRKGDYPQAVAALTRSAEFNAHRSGEVRPVGIGFLAMAHHGLGEEAKARELLARLREMIKDNRWKSDAESLSLLHEAEALIESEPKLK